MRLALLFSGQGNQQLSHFEFLKNNAPKEWIATLKNELSSLWDSSDKMLLTNNQIAQPLICALQLLRWQLLVSKLPLPCCVAGYSIGEVAACSMAGSFTPLKAIEFSGMRAKLMNLATNQDWSMIAVLGLTESQTLKVANLHHLHLAIRNTPEHFVLAGQPQQCHQAVDDFLHSGAKRVVPVNVNVPSHTSLLNQASQSFFQFLQNNEIISSSPTLLNFPVLSAVDGRSNFFKEKALVALAKQISTPLDWSVCMDILEEMQPDVVLEMGPGNALARMFLERQSYIPARSVDDFQHLDGVIQWITSI